MLNRQQLLLELVHYNRPIEHIANELNSFPWDSEKTLVTVTSENLKNILHRFLDGEFSANQIEQWANVIEGRDDIAFEETYKDVIPEIIHQLANPMLTEDIHEISVKTILAALE